MAKIIYTQIPTFEKFKSDSAVLVGSRAADTILTQIENALDRYHKAGGYVTAEEAKLDRTLLLGRLYFAADLWLKENPKGIGDKGRKPAIQSLFEITCISLSKLTGYAINLLPGWIEETYGRGLNAHAVSLDYTKNCAEYLTESQVDRFRIQFKNGAAFHFDGTTEDAKLVPLDTAAMGKGAVVNDKRQPDVFQTQKWDPGHAGYVQGMGGDFFCTNHVLKNVGKNFYHSSYLAGGSVRCAGTWLVVQGRVARITTMSGHYTPTQDHLIRAVETLKANGVNMDTLVVKAHDQVETNGTEFLRQRSFKSLAAQQRAFNESAAAVFKVKVDGTEANREHNGVVARTVVTMAEHIKNKSHRDKADKPVANLDDCYFCEIQSKDTRKKAEELVKIWASQR